MTALSYRSLRRSNGCRLAGQDGGDLRPGPAMPPRTLTGVTLAIDDHASAAPAQPNSAVRGGTPRFTFVSLREADVRRAGLQGRLPRLTLSFRRR